MSGSKITARQFLAYRVIWPTRKLASELEVLNEAQAKKIVQEMDFFEQYYDEIAQGETTAPPSKLGTFQLARDSQLQIGNILPGRIEPPSQNIIGSNV